MYFKEYALPLALFTVTMGLKVCALAILCSAHLEAKKIEHPHTHDELILRLGVRKDTTMI